MFKYVIPQYLHTKLTKQTLFLYYYYMKIISSKHNLTKLTVRIRNFYMTPKMMDDQIFSTYSPPYTTLRVDQKLKFLFFNSFQKLYILYMSLYAKSSIRNVFYMFKHGK